MHYIIYKIINNINGKIYVGKHKTTNIYDSYMGSGIDLQKDIKKYGIENFSKEILEECENEQMMNERERQIVNENFVADENTYNKILGGGIGGLYEIAHLGGKSLHNKIKKFGLEKEYSKTQSIKSIMSWKNPEIRQKRIDAFKKYWKTHDGPNLGNTGKKDSHYNKKRIINDETGESKFIGINETIPDGWRRGFKKLMYGIKNLNELKNLYEIYKLNGITKIREILKNDKIKSFQFKNMCEKHFKLQNSNTIERK